VGLLGFVNDLVFFAQNHTVIAIVVALGLLIFLYRKPKLFFTLLFIGLFVMGVFYMITKMAGSGSEGKKRLIPEEDKQSNNIR